MFWPKDTGELGYIYKIIQTCTPKTYKEKSWVCMFQAVKKEDELCLTGISRFGAICSRTSNRQALAGKPEEEIAFQTE